MFRKLNSLYWLSRSKLRRGPKFQDSLKDYSSIHAIKKQIKAEREKFQQSSSDTFSQVLGDPKPKLKARFKIDKTKLNHDIKKMVKEHMRTDNLQPMGSGGKDLKFLQQSRSYLHDQRAQVEFQQKFRKQLFMKKETQRMLKREQNNHENFLPKNESNRYNKYLEAKMKLKNNRIDSMMNYKRNNEELQLLLDSGFMEEPNNLKMIIDKINHKETAEEADQRMQEEIKAIEQKKSTAITDLAQQKQLTLQDKMEENVVGPQQLRDFTKIEQFLQRYEASSEQDKLKAAEDVDLLLKVREYQRSLFLSRYDQINFRFKGRVKFQNFKEFELLSYIKHEEIQPQSLLELFDQNKQSLSKFGVPVITPAVMSRIYAKTSTYRFAQSDQNNHINLLSHPSFIKLEKSLFRELDKISDELYCDAVSTYAKNHEHEEGILNVAMSNAIQKAIFNEMMERIGRLREVDLGLLLRSFMKLNYLKNEEFNERWGEVVEVLKYRLPEMKQPYEYESVMEFVHLLPASGSSIELIVSNLNFFDKYPWQERGTILTFSRICSSLINNCKLIEQIQHNKTFMRLTQIISNQTENLKKLIPVLTINQISSVLIIFAELNKYPLAREIPPILINIAKKEVVDSIHMQKHKVYQYTIPTIITTLSSYDYHQNILKKQSKFMDTRDLITPFQPKNIMKVVPLKHLLPGRAIVYNSKLYFVYHQLAKFMEVQSEALSIRSIAESLYGLSLVQYKNQGIYDSMTYKVLQRIQKQQRQQKKEHLSLKQTTELIKIVNSYSLQKRSTTLIEQIFEKVLKQGKHHFRNIQLNILINFFASYVNIFSLPTEPPKEDSPTYDVSLEKWKKNKACIYIFAAIYRDLLSDFLNKLEDQEIITLYIINTHFLNNTSRILQSQDYSIQSDFTQINKRFRDNTVQLLKKILEMPAQNLKVDYRFAISLCYQLNALDLKEEQIIVEGYIKDFSKVEQQFHNRYIQEIMIHEQNVGSAFSYNQVYQNMLAKLTKESPQHKIHQLTWRIQVQDQRTVYFIATYEHLLARHNDSETSLGLFGLWKLYSQLYRRKGWTFKLVCTMLQ